MSAETEGPRTEGVAQIPEMPTVSESLASEGVAVTPQNPTPVTDRGQALTSTQPSAGGPVIYLPDDATIARLKGSGQVTNAAVWLGVFLERIKKQAMQLGRKIVHKPLPQKT